MLGDVLAQYVGGIVGQAEGVRRNIAVQYWQHSYSRKMEGTEPVNGCRGVSSLEGPMMKHSRGR